MMSVRTANSGLMRWTNRFRCGCVKTRAVVWFTSIMDKLEIDSDWTELAKLGLAGIAGLAVNGAILALLLGGGDVMRLADGVAYLAPAVILAAALFHLHTPSEHPLIAPPILFLTLIAANAASLMVKVFRAGGQSNPVMTALILTVVAVMFTPGPFIGVASARRWWV